jgi:hypothetical protein
MWRIVWRCQRGNENPQIGEEETILWPKKDNNVLQNPKNRKK